VPNRRRSARTRKGSHEIAGGSRDGLRRHCASNAAFVSAHPDMRTRKRMRRRRATRRGQPPCAAIRDRNRLKERCGARIDDFVNLQAPATLSPLALHFRDDLQA